MPLEWQAQGGCTAGAEPPDALPCTAPHRAVQGAEQRVAALAGRLREMEALVAEVCGGRCGGRLAAETAQVEQPHLAMRAAAALQQQCDPQRRAEHCSDMTGLPLLLGTAAAVACRLAPPV